MTYLKNVWYMAAWAREIPDDQGMFTRTLLDRPVLIYRRSGGHLVAMDDRCPHRFAPLSKGKRVGDDVVCGYHGLRFDCSGKCVKNPFSEGIPAAAVVRTYPVVERHTAVWVWFGDPSKADPALIADFSFMEHAGIGRGHIRMEANYELLTDNLMDLSHIEFVHTGTFGGGGVIFQGKHEVKQEGSTLQSNWNMPAIDPPPWATPGEKVDHWLDTCWHAPATMSLEIGIAPAGTPRSEVPAMKGANIITPETEGSSHYFYTFPDFGMGTESDVVGRAFTEEDQPMIESVQRAMGRTEFWSMKPVLLSVDAGAVRARRVLAQLIDAEQAEAASPAST